MSERKWHQHTARCGGKWTGDLGEYRDDPFAITYTCGYETERRKLAKGVPFQLRSGQDRRNPGDAPVDADSAAVIAAMRVELAAKDARIAELEAELKHEHHQKDSVVDCNGGGVCGDGGGGGSEEMEEEEDEHFPLVLLLADVRPDLS